MLRLRAEPDVACDVIGRSEARARARNCGPRKITAGPLCDRPVSRGSAPKVLKMMRDSGSDAFWTTATGVDGDLPAAISVTEIASASPAPI